MGGQPLSGNGVTAPTPRAGHISAGISVPDHRAASRAWPRKMTGGVAMAGAKGRSGRRPMPTKLKLLAGNPGKRRLDEHEPEPASRLPEPPDHLSDEAKREWSRVGELLLDLGLVSELDRAALALYCQARARWVEAEEARRQIWRRHQKTERLPDAVTLPVRRQQGPRADARLPHRARHDPASRTKVHGEPRAKPDPLEELRTRHRRSAQ